MADMITRCPKCGTAFRISDTLLKSAKGVVRCGSCLSVFNAREHLETKSRPTQISTPPEPPPVKPPQEARDWRMNALEESLFERQPPPVQDEDDEEDDEAWALELLKDDSDLNVRFKKVSPAPAPQTESPAVEFPLEEHPAVEDNPESEPGFDTERDSREDMETRGSTDQIQSPEPTPPTPTPSTEREEPFEPAATAATPPYIEESESPAPAPPAKPESAEPEPKQKRKPIRPRFEPKSVPLEQVIAALEPEPLELDWQQPGSWKKRLLWPLLVLFALLGLLAQVAWLEFPRLNRIEPYRSVYGIACRVIGCTLPELRDRSQISTSNFMVRSHPGVAGALQVDVILQNNAAFEQTFPDIRLTFSNLHNETVASRVLQPAEYLGGELAGRDKMPVRQPIHIGLEIADPGQEAVSYHIDIAD